MNLITYPLNNIEYRAEDAELFHCTRTSGVWAEKSFTCTVSGEDNNITVDKGVAWIQNTEFAGKVVAMKGVTVIDAGVADDLNDRIDVVAIQFDANENETKIVVKHGDPVLTNPQIPEINRSGGLFELYLCSIYRTAGKTAISSSDVTDLRLNPDYCGLMADSVTKIDTSMIESQVTELIDFLKSQIDDLSLTAENVTYDNSESKIEAENLQAAVDHIIQSIINNYYNKKTTNNLINDAKTDASKVATNYLSLIDSTKLEIGIIDGNSWKGYRTQIASNAVNIFGTDNNEVASFCLDNIKLNSAQVDVTGRICGTTQGVSWYMGRDYALLASTNAATASTYFPVVDCKAQTGDWSMGCLGDNLYFVFTQDSNYSAGNNVVNKIGIRYDGMPLLGGSTPLIESGTWTPKLICEGTGAVNPTYTHSYNGTAGSPIGRYTRIGNLVYVQCYIPALISAAGTGLAAISGLPYAGSGDMDSTLVNRGYINALNGSVSTLNPVLKVSSGGTTVGYRIPDGSGGYNWKVNTSTSPKGSLIQFAGVYRIG